MKQKKRAMKLRTIIGSVCLLLILTVGSAQATPLNLTLFDFPDINATLISVSYDAGADTLVAEGFAVTFDDDGVPPQEIIAFSFPTLNYKITATIDEFGNPSGGSLEVTGTIPTLSLPDSGTLLEGILTAFGFIDSPGGDILEFLFDVTGGDLASFYGPVAGVILDANFNGAFDGTFTSSFQNSGSGTNNIGAPVPEPGTLLLMLTGLAGLYGLRKRQELKIPETRPDL